MMKAIRTGQQSDGILNAFGRRTRPSARANRPKAGWMPKWAALAALVICLAFSCPAVLLSAAPIATDAGGVMVGASVSFSPGAAVIHGCETIPVEVWVNNVAALYGADVKVSFDKIVFEVVDANLAKPGIQVQAGSFLSPDFVVHDEADNTAGTLEYTVSQAAPSLPVSGNGVLFTIRFRAKSSATASALHFTQAQLTDLDGLLLAVTLVDNTVTTVAPDAPSPLGIAKLNASNVRLSWGSSLGVANYHLYRKTLPYFVPVNPAYQVTTALIYDDLDALGDPADNYYYVVESACANDFYSGPSNRVGEFDFALVPGAS
jgi:hypothetical protein